LLKEGEIRIPSGCAISGMMNKRRVRFSGEDIIKSIALMHDRSNGLGGGFAAYGIYPEYADHYALHIYYDDSGIKQITEEFLSSRFNIAESHETPTKKVSAIKNPPIPWRYFVKPKNEFIHEEITADEFVMNTVMMINAEFDGAFVVSSGKNMGAFKGVGFPEDIGEFFRLNEYKGYIWTSHGRFPTNTPGWWGGAHPFTLLDWSIVHNGEISSYGANKRYLEMFGYKLALQTDTEAITYAFDLLIRKHNLDVETACFVLAPPFWKNIERMDPVKQEYFKTLRAVYGNLLLNGPFSIILGSSQGIVALNDRIKLRPLVAATKGDNLYVASEESAIREICPDPDLVWTPRGGEPVIGLLEEGGYEYGHQYANA